MGGRKMKYLFVLNDAPYGNERSYNGLRLAMALQKQSNENEVTVYMMGDAVNNGIGNQKTPDGYYNVERMLKGILVKKGKVKL